MSYSVYPARAIEIIGYVNQVSLTADTSDDLEDGMLDVDMVKTLLMKTPYKQTRKAYIAHNGRKYVGYCIVAHHTEGRVLDLIYVDRNIRGHGIAKALLKASGATTVNVSKNNAKAIKFYERNGLTIELDY